MYNRHQSKKTQEVSRARLRDGLNSLRTNVGNDTRINMNCEKLGKKEE